LIGKNTLGIFAKIPGVFFDLAEDNTSRICVWSEKTPWEP